MTKIYLKTIEQPRLIIEHDQDAESPRKSFDNLGYFITVERNKYSPDQDDELIQIVKSAGEEANSQEQHIKLIKELLLLTTTHKPVAIYPIHKEEHGNINYYLGTRHGFDISNCGFYIVTKESQKLIGVKKKDFEKIIKSELEDYNAWVNGDIYQFTLYDTDGEETDSCSGFYTIDDIKDCLPEEWKNEDLTNYLK